MTNFNSDLKRLQLIANRIVDAKIDITSTYDNWFHVTAACASLGEQAREPYQLICSNYPGYTPQECDSKFDNCLRTGNGSITIATLLKMAQDAGVDTSMPLMSDPPASVSSAATQQSDKERLAELERELITTKTEVPPEDPMLTVDGIGIFAKGDIHGIKSKQKQGKTTVLKVIVAALMKGSLFRLKACMDDARILWLDTEQKRTDVKLILEDIRRLTNLDDDYIDKHLRLYTLRKRTYKTLRDDLTLLVKTHHPNIIIIDGVVEFVASFNDEMMSRDIIQHLMLLADEENCSIVNVLHENKSADDDNMRGHLGTMLAQAAGTVLQCTRSQQGIITASCSDARHDPMPSWSIMFNDEGQILDADDQQRIEQERKNQNRKEKTKAQQEKRMKERSSIAIQIVRNNDGSITRKELKNQLMEKLELAESTVQEVIKYSLGNGLMVADGKNCLTTPEDQNQPAN